MTNVMTNSMMDRERLIQLIKDAEEAFSETGRPVLDIEEFVADYLLNNGVIITQT